MSSNVCHCPDCDAALTLPEGHDRDKKLRCPNCSTVFRAGSTANRPTRTSGKSKDASTRPSAVRRKDDSEDLERTRERQRSRRHGGRREKEAPAAAGRATMIWLLAVGGGLLALGLVAVVVVIMLWKKTPETQIADNTPRIVQRTDGQKPAPEQPEGKAAVTRNAEPEQDDDGEESPQRQRQGDKEGQPIPVLDPPGHTAQAMKVLFTPNGESIISISLDKTIRLWDVYTGEVLLALRLPIGPGEEGFLYSAAISPDGKTLAVSGLTYGSTEKGTPIFFVSLQDGEVQRTLRGNPGSVSSLHFSPDGQRLVAAGVDGTAAVFQLPEGRLLTRLEGHTDRIHQVAFHPTANLIATVSSDRTGRLWDLGRDLRRSLGGHAAPVNCLAWSPDGSVLATGSVDGSVRFWSVDGDFIRGIRFSVGQIACQITSLSYLPGGKELLFTGIATRGVAGVLDGFTGSARLLFGRHSNTVTHGSLSPDGRLAASAGGDDNEIYLWKTADGSVVHRLQSGGRSVWSVGWNRDGTVIGWGNRNQGNSILAQPPLERSFRLEEFELGEKPTEGFRGHSTTLEGYSLEPVDLMRVAIKRGGQLIHIFESPRRNERIYSAALVPGGRVLFGAAYSRIYLFDLRDMKILREFSGHTGIVLAISPSPTTDYFLTGSNDQTLRIWHPDRSEPVLSLFVVGQDWIAWTPEGFYAASAYGERLIGWQVNNGGRKMASYYPAVQFRQSLYQPELLRHLLPAGSVKAALAKVRIGQDEVDTNVSVAQVLPPEVAITAPVAAGVVRIDQDKIDVRATARSVGNHPVTALRLLVDGRPYDGEKGVRKLDVPKLGRAEASWTVSLAAGKHTLAVQAETAKSKGVSQLVEVFRGGQKELPTLHLLAVGISAYPGKMRLRYAASDAGLIANGLDAGAKGVFGRFAPRLITDREATRKRILQELDRLATVSKPGDVTIFSFSGHGSRDDAGNFYLVPVEASARDIPGTCISSDILKQRLANIPGRVIAMLDACHSGAAAEDFRPGRMDSLVRDLLTDDFGVVVMCSSLGKESSLESSQTKAGYFSLGVSEGLAGKADHNKDRFVYIHELDSYVRGRVQELSLGRQNPLTGRPPTVRSFPLARF